MKITVLWVVTVVLVTDSAYIKIWCDFDRASSLICGNNMPTRCNRGFYCRSYCLLNMFRTPLCPSSGAREYYTVVVACGFSCCGFQVAGLVWSWGLCVRFAGCCSTSHKGLSPCDFHLIPKMKEPFRGIRFRTVPEILQAVDRSIRAINTTGAAKGILRLPHRWQFFFFFANLATFINKLIYVC